MIDTLKELALLASALVFALLIAVSREVSIEYTLLTTLGAYFIWHLVQLVRLNLWSSWPKRFSPPIAVGIWHGIVLRLLSWRRINTKRKRKLARMIAEIEQSYRAIADVTMIVNKNDKIEWMNDAAMEFSSQKPSKVVGMRFQKAFSEQADLIKFFKQGMFHRSIKIKPYKDQETTLEVRIFPYGDDKKLINAQDISEIYQLQRVRQDFVANVSHEMRTPLTVLSGYLETMNDSRYFDETPWRDAIETMHIQTLRLTHIVDDLLVLARLDSADDDESDENGMVIDVQRILSPILIEAQHLSGKAKHDIRVRYEGSTQFYGQAQEMDSIMSNLVFNAIKYTPAKGVIEINWVQNSSAAVFEVIDSGIGISKKHLPRLTERFYRVDTGRSRESGGTGLGLAIVKHALNRLGGELEIKSIKGEGSIFRCHFPNEPDTP